MPVMDAWVITTNFDDPILISERNPYYFKVDTAGNQLPYVDTLHRILVEDIEVMKLQLINGQLDYITRHLWTTYGDLPMYMAYQQQGDYRIIRTNGGTPGGINIMFNATYKADPVIAELINNIEFKKALSYAIDREEINNVRFSGLGNIATVISIRSILVMWRKSTRPIPNITRTGNKILMTRLTPATAKATASVPTVTLTLIIDGSLTTAPCRCRRADHKLLERYRHQACSQCDRPRLVGIQARGQRAYADLRRFG